jgi:DNA (cytosine-5)-methyltransferase 1
MIATMHSEISPALKARDAKGPSSDGDGDGAILVPMSRPIALQDVRAVEKMQNGKGWNDDGTAYTVDTHATQGVMQPIPFDTTQITSKANYSKPQAGDPCHPLAAGAHPPAIAQPIAFSRNDDGRDATHNLAPTMRVAGNAGGVLAAAVGFDAYNQTIQGQVNQPLRVSSAPGQVDAVGGILQGMAVRRLTPVECERLQGFPDGYTDIQSKGKATPDGPRYKALGNSMAVPVMHWIGKRIQDQLK